jgi:hypothetical protein
MEQGFTYRRVQPDINEAELISSLIDNFVGSQIAELAQAGKLAHIHTLTGMQQRWSELVAWLKTEEAPTPVATDIAPSNETPRRTRTKGGDAAAATDAT